MVNKTVSALCTEQDLTHTAVARVLARAKVKALETLSLEYFQERLTTIKEYSDSINKIHAKLLAEVPVDVRSSLVYFSSNQYEDILDTIDEASDFFLDHINRIHNARATANAHSSNSSSSQGNSSNVVNLPKLQFPKFNGNFADWSSFSDLFKSSVHNNQSLTDAQKLQYLRSSLVGDAYEVIKSYAITDDNYASAWSCLCERFENKRIIKTALLNTLFDLPAVNNSNLSNLTKLFDTYKQVLESMKNLCSPITNDGMLLVHLIVQRFELSLKREWEVFIADETDYPDLEKLDKFLLSRIRTLGAMSLSTSGTSKDRTPPKPSKLNSFNATRSERINHCPACEGLHRLNTCDKFLGMSNSNRYEIVRSKRLCFNCLAPGHSADVCSSVFRCRKCSKSHHSLIHREEPSKMRDKVPVENYVTKQKSSTQQVNSLFNATTHPRTLLATAIVMAIAPNGRTLPVRALLDLGSETSFVSEKVAQQLKLPRYAANVDVSGIGGELSTSLKSSTTFAVNALNAKGKATPVDAYILPRPTAYTPKAFEPGKYPELKGIKLSDPRPASYGKVDIVLGADIYADVIREGIIRLSNSKVIAQNTKFGWVLFGPTKKNSHRIITAQHSSFDISQQLEKFWTVEEVPTSEMPKEEDEFCEAHFLRTYKRDETGRFIVKLPFKEHFQGNELGESRRKALGSFNQLQRRFAQGKSAFEEYQDFMLEYEQLGHMTRVRESADVEKVYLPHHAVIKEQSCTTKLRVVFNASSPTSTGKSLNDVLCAGPKLQNDIVSILTNWRLFPHVLIADIEKMFRQILLSKEDWKYQCVLWSRTEKLLNSALWWSGPEWLRTHFQIKHEPPEETAEEKRKVIVNTLISIPKPTEFFMKFSSWTKTLNATSYLFKFARLCREKKAVFSTQLPREDTKRATLAILRLVQRELFYDEIKALEQGKAIPRQSRLLKLSPFLDETGILRIGGRLDWADGLTFEQKHPIILSTHHITTLIVKHYHLKSLHAGLQLSLQIICNSYWILNARSLVKTVIHNCVNCVRQAAKLEKEKMSSLPPSRCSPSRVFSHVGVDYAGPFNILATTGRGRHTSKMYIALFVCFSTRAIHLEVVSNYATSGFMAALQRFIARRGIPEIIYSDNGTNFQGANSELRKAFKTALRDPSLQNAFTSDNLQWQFIPPSAPHFGGLWEAGVKCVKHHLKRVVGRFTPTLEEFSTLLCRIEACLNSRPICRIGDEPSESPALTPGHFLVGTSLTTLPEPSYLELRENRLSRWQTISKMTQHFWKRWNTEYLQSLQSRNKWNEENATIQLDDIVLVRDPNLPPAHWLLGRVIEIRESKDNRIRVVSIKTATTTLIRPITQLCKLPVSA